MYDELIKRLRECTAEMNGEKTLWQQAADAIEDLQKQLQKSEVDNINLTGWLAEEHAKHLWIPVTERLPEDRNMVLATVDGVVCIAFYGNYMWEEVETYSILYPTHWMSIPQPPKDVET